jgi:hypothetical protein
MEKDSDSLQRQLAANDDQSTCLNAFPKAVVRIEFDGAIDK